MENGSQKPDVVDDLHCHSNDDYGKKMDDLINDGHDRRMRVKLCVITAEETTQNCTIFFCYIKL